MATQTELNISEPIDDVETYKFDPIQGEPMLHWKGKRPFQSMQYYPAQLKETYGKEVEDWHNKIYWGDNLQVMSHLLKTYRGKITLVYIDPPYDSKADYKKRIQLQGKTVENDHGVFEEKQYTDIWTNDEYLQFMYERLILMRELLADNGSIYVHCDWRMNAPLRFVLNEIFTEPNFVNEIIWKRKQSQAWSADQFGITNDTLLLYGKSPNRIFNPIYSKEDEHTKKYIKERFIFDDGDGRKYMKSPLINPLVRPNLQYEFHGVQSPKTGWLYKKERMEEMYQNNELVMPDNPTARIYRKIYADTYPGQLVQNVWVDISIVNPMAEERVDYPTQKPEALLERIIKASSNPDDLIFDCFMGSGTTQAAAMKLGRRFIGADINLGAVDVTTKRLLKEAAKIQENTTQQEIDLEEEAEGTQTFYTGFEVYNVNHYDIFRNPVEAKDLLIEALEICPLPNSSIYDGVKDERKVKIMPINRIATRADLNELIAGFDYQAFVRRQEEHPTLPVEKLLLICMGHEPDLAAALQNEVLHKLDIEVVDILRDKSKLEFKRESKAKIVRRNGHLIIEQFYPMNLLQKLSLMEENVEDWRELVESVKVDFNYDSAVLNPSVVDIPEEDELVSGSYPIPEDAGTIQVKITDLLSESLEETLE